MKVDKAELDSIVRTVIGGSYGETKPVTKTPVFSDDAQITTTQSLLGKVTPPQKKKFKITVERVEGLCVFGHKPGDVFYMDGDSTPEGICLPAFSGLLPYLNAMICDAEFWWEPVRGKIRLGCPDPDNHVTFCIEIVK